MFCPKCGKDNPDINEFCGACGESLKNKVRVKSQNTTMRPIFWGLIAFAVGFMGLMVFRGTSVGAFQVLGRLSSLLFLVSLPFAIVIEIVLWIARSR